MSIALAVNVYQDAKMLRGLLESGSRYFDNIFVINSGPGGAASTDGTIELCNEFGIKPLFDDIQKGFGYIRSRLIHECGCDFAMVLDADERFYPQMNVLTCEGTEKYPDVPSPNLTVTTRKEVIDQGAHVKNLIKNPNVMAIRATRRHWFDFTLKKPAQNWMNIKDHQLRIVRNIKEIGYEKDRVMHERLLDYRTHKDPAFASQDDLGGPFIDHFHMFSRVNEPGKKELNESRYELLSKGLPMI